MPAKARDTQFLRAGPTGGCEQLDVGPCERSKHSHQPIWPLWASMGPAEPTPDEPCPACHMRPGVKEHESEQAGPHRLGASQAPHRGLTGGLVSLTCP